MRVRLLPQQHFGGAVGLEHAVHPESAERTLTAADQAGFASSILGQGVTDLDQAIAEGYLRLATWPGGSMLAMRAAPQQEFFVVLTGRLEVVRTRADGGRHIMDVVTAGGACGAVTAFGPNPRWPAEVYAARPVRVLVVSMDKLLSSAPPQKLQQALLQNCSRLLADRALHLNARSELLARRGLRARLAFHLLRRADAAGQVISDLTRQELADHLQVSRASMTRELGRMADDQLIEIQGRRFQITDREELRKLAG